jgi:hypothetical protein
MKIPGQLIAPSKILREIRVFFILRDLAMPQKKKEFPV